MQEYTLESFDGTSLYMRIDRIKSPKAAVLLCHGLGEHCGRYDWVANTLNSYGCSVYRYDQRGHGRSGGIKGYLSNYTELSYDFEAAMHYVHSQEGTLPTFLYGHSMGGLTSSLYLSMPHEPLAGAILSSPFVVDNYGVVRNLPEGHDPMEYLPQGDCSGLCTNADICRDFVNDPYNSKANSFGLFYSVRDGILHLNTTMDTINDPILILHGSADTVVSEKDSRDMFGAISSTDKELRIYANLYHEIWNEDRKQQILRDVAEWIEGHI